MFYVCSSVHYQLKNNHRCQEQNTNMLHSCTIFFFKTLGVCLSEIVPGLGLLMWTLQQLPPSSEYPR